MSRLHLARDLVIALLRGLTNELALLGRDAGVIGTVTEAHPAMVLMQTEIGGTRVLDTLFGEQLPRIC